MLRTEPCWRSDVGVCRFIVDAADRNALPIAKDELHSLLQKSELEGIPLLVLGNKSDLPERLSVDDLIEAMDLDAVMQWLIARAK